MSGRTRPRSRAASSPAIRLAAIVAGLGLLGAACADDSVNQAAAAPSSTSIPTSVTPVDTQRVGAGPADDTSNSTGEPGGDTSADTGTSGTPSTTPSSTTTTAAPTTTTTEPEPAELAPIDPDAPDRGVVKTLQTRLGELGFAPGPADGSYGGRTVAAVSAFQGLVGLPVTGEADAATIAALETYQYDGPVAHQGDSGPAVAEIQQRLADSPFDPGPVDGQYGTSTIQAVWALEKLAGIPADGDWGPLDEESWRKLQAGTIGGPERSADVRWVEVDISQQVMKVYDPGSATPVLISHVSTGSGVPWENETYSGESETPLGDFTITRRISGWRESSLDIGRLYNPLYFNGGIAFHGALSVPNYPASHGCVRVPMSIAEYLPGVLPNGTPVYVLA
ncbi:MAG: peptidoglycan-binding protein [Acidimicrobiales bacterium]